MRWVSGLAALRPDESWGFLVLKFGYGWVGYADECGALNGLGVPPCGASYFLLLRQKKSKQRKGDPWVSAGYAGSLRYSKRRAVGETRLRLRQRQPTAPGASALLSTSQGAR